MEHSSEFARDPGTGASAPSALILGVGSFAQSVAQILKEDGAAVATYLSRNYGHYPPTQVGPTFGAGAGPDLMAVIKQRAVDLVIPQSIDWAQAAWAEALLQSSAGLLCATGEAMRIERDRAFAGNLCAEFGIPFPASFVARDRAQAEAGLARRPGAFVIKNPLCAPTSPVHTIVCESAAATRRWLGSVDYSEGVFLQEFAGRREAGHIVMVSAGEIHSLVTNQEYKRAFNGNLGIVAGSPLGGIVEADPGDRYGLARELIHPLRPWLRAVNFHGPLQVTAIQREGRWCVIEYNIRIGVTSGPMILRLLSNPLATLLGVARNQPVQPQFRSERRYGASITLAGYGYPFPSIQGPPVPVDIDPPVDKTEADVWWSDVARSPDGEMLAVGQRIADVIGYGVELPTALARAYRNIRCLHSAGSYYRTDIGQSLWPPGSD